MKRLLSLLLLAAFIGCGQGPKVERRTEFKVEGTHQKAIIAERVEGQSPFKVDLWMAPEEPRANAETRFQIFVDDERHQPVPGAQVHISLVMPLMDMGKSEFTAKEAPPGDFPNHPVRGVYEATGKFTMADEWEVFVTVTKDGKKGVHVFNVRVAE